MRHIKQVTCGHSIVWQTAHQAMTCLICALQVQVVTQMVLQVGPLMQGTFAFAANADLHRKGQFARPLLQICRDRNDTHARSSLMLYLRRLEDKLYAPKPQLKLPLLHSTPH